MRAWWRCLPALGCCGCLVVPKEQTTVTPVATQSTPWHAGPAGPLQFEVQGQGATLRIHTSYQRFCTRVSYQTNDVTRGYSPDVIVDNGPPSDNGFAVVAGAFMMALTVMTVAANQPTTTRETEKTVETDACPLVAADVHFDVRMPSGAMVQVTTDASGLAILPIEGEPIAGELTVWANGPARKLRYNRYAPKPIMDPDSCKAQRSAAMTAAHQIADLRQRTRALLALPPCPTTGS